MTVPLTAAAVCGYSEMDARKRWLLALGAAIYVFGVLCCQRAGDAMGLTWLILRQGAQAGDVEEMTAREMEEDVPVRFCFLGQMGEDTVTGAVTGAARRVRVTCLAGNPELAGGSGLTWQQGCLVDEATAQALFGTAQCGGQTLLWKGETYPVLGMVSGGQARMVRMARKEDGDILDRCLLEVSPENGKALAEGFLLRHGLEGTALDFFPFWALTKDLLLLFPCLVLLTLAGRLGRDWRRLGRKQGGWKGLAKTAASIGLLGAALWLVKAHIVIPSDMIPSRWSDFSFWGIWWERQKENLFHILSAAPYEEQLQMAGNMVKSMGSALAGFLLAALAMREEHHANTAD